MAVKWLDPPPQTPQQGEPRPVQRQGGIKWLDAAPTNVQPASDPRLAPSTSNVAYGPGAAESGQSITAGQEQYARQNPPNLTFPAGSRENPRFETPTSGAPRREDAPYYVGLLGKLVAQDGGETPQHTLGALGGRAAMGILGGPAGQAMGGAAFPSDRLEAMGSGGLSGLLLGGKNETIAGTSGLGAKLRGGEYGPEYEATRTELDERDRYLRMAYPKSYYGAGALGAVGGALLTPEIKAAQAAAPAARIAARVGQTALDTGVSALSGALSSDPGQRTEGALTGGLGGAVLSRLTRGRIVPKSPRAVQKQSAGRLLLNEGVPLTIGQSAGGVLKTTEDAMTSIPLVGDLIQSARGKGVEGLNRAAINRTLGPIGKRLPKDVEVGFDGVEFADDAISEAYDKALVDVTMRPDQDFMAAREALVSAADELPGDVAVGIRNILRNRIDKRLESGALDGLTWKKIDSELAHKARAYSRSPDPLMHDGADIIDDARQAMRDLLERQSPETAEAVGRANAAFANLVRVQRAARRAKGGKFSPEQLRNAVLAEDSSVRGRASSKNQALMQDLADAASHVLPSSIPDSGTPRRLMLNLGAGGGLAASGMISPAPMIAAGLASLSYLPGVRGAISGLSRNVPKIGKAVVKIPGARRTGRVIQRASPRVGQITGQRQ